MYTCTCIMYVLGLTLVICVCPQSMLLLILDTCMGVPAKPLEAHQDFKILSCMTESTCKSFRVFCIYFFMKSPLRNCKTEVPPNLWSIRHARSFSFKALLLFCGQFNFVRAIATCFCFAIIELLGASKVSRKYHASPQAAQDLAEI